MTAANMTRCRRRLQSLEGRVAPATFTVNDLSDAGGVTGVGAGDAGDLRYCVTRANASPDPDSIRFDPDLAGQTVALTQIGDGSIGPTALMVTTPVAIAGSGQVITRSGDVAFRLFAVAPAGSLTLSGLTLRNGLAQGGEGLGGGGSATGLGGAVYNQGVLRIDGCTIAGNQAVGGTSSPDTGAFGPGGLGIPPGGRRRGRPGWSRGGRRQRWATERR